MKCQCSIGFRCYLEMAFPEPRPLIDYGPHHEAGKPISTSQAEGPVNQLVSARMNKRQQMRWLPCDTHRVLQVRAAVLDGRFGHPAIQRAK